MAEHVADESSANLGSAGLAVYRVALTGHGTRRQRKCRGHNRADIGVANACVVVDIRFARGRRTAGGTRGAVAGARRGGAGVRATGRGVRGAAGRFRRAAGAVRRAGTRPGDRGDASVGGRTCAGTWTGWSPRSSTRSPPRPTVAMRWWRPACAGGGRRAVGGRKLGIHYVYASYHPTDLPSPHHRPPTFWRWSLPPDLTDNRVLWDLDAKNVNALFGATLNRHRSSIGLSPVDNVRDHAFTDHPWLAADPTLGPWPEPTDLLSSKPARGSCRTNARCRPSWWRSWTPAHHRYTWGSAACHCALPRTSPRVAIEAIRAQGHRALALAGWAELALDRRPRRLLRRRRGQPAGAVRPGGRRRAPRRRRHDDDGSPGLARPRSCYRRGRTSCTGPAGWSTWASAPVTTVGPRPSSPCRPRLRPPLSPETRARASAVAGSDPHRRGDGGREAAAGRGQPGKVRGARLSARVSAAAPNRRAPSSPSSAARRRRRRRARCPAPRTRAPAEYHSMCADAGRRQRLVQLLGVVGRERRVVLGATHVHRGLIRSASRCGLSAVSVTSPPPWKDAAAATRSGTRPATTSEVRPPMQ